MSIELASASLPIVCPGSATMTTGRLYFWQGGSLWIGQGSGRAQWHAHHAHQLSVAHVGDFRFRTDAKGPWTVYEGAVVPSHCSHQFEVDGSTMAHLFIEPESRAGRAVTAQFAANAVSELTAETTRQAADALFETFKINPERSSMVRAASHAMLLLCGEGTTDADRALDPRLTQALQFIHTHVRRPMTLGEVAAAVHLSESRFRHLFVAETGNSFRSYLLWLRINLAIEAVMSGATWTEAAHEAGFADSAHLTRTHKRMFGIEPSAIRPKAVVGLGLSLAT